jgi:hypothetical protein
MDFVRINHDFSAKMPTAVELIIDEHPERLVADVDTI